MEVCANVSQRDCQRRVSLSKLQRFVARGRLLARHGRHPTRRRPSHRRQILDHLLESVLYTADQQCAGRSPGDKTTVHSLFAQVAGVLFESKAGALQSLHGLSCAVNVVCVLFVRFANKIIRIKKMFLKKQICFFLKKYFKAK